MVDDRFFAPLIVPRRSCGWEKKWGRGVLRWVIGMAQGSGGSERTGRFGVFG